MDLFAAIVLAVFHFGPVYSQDPEIAENILPEVKRQGTAGKLRCAIINQQNNPVFWIHQPTQSIITENDKIVIDGKHNTVLNGWPKYMVVRTYDGEKTVYTLIVNRLEIRDSGSYSCQIMVRGTDNYPAKHGEMVVLSPPSIIQASTSHSEQVKEGASINLTCKASGYPAPTITWVRGNGSPFPSTGKLTYHGSVLPLARVTRHERGIYRCLADNNVRPPARQDITLNVFFRPYGAAVQSSYGQAENRMLDVIIECVITGWPDPDLQWFKIQDGGKWQPIQENDKYAVNVLLNHANTLQTHERWMQLLIRSVQAGDYGDYACQGTNEHGSGYGIVTVYATSECQGANCPPEFLSSSATKVLLCRASPFLRILSVLFVTQAFGLY